MFRKKELTIENLIADTTNQVAADLSSLTDQRNTAIGVFSRTAATLAGVNERLAERKTQLQDLIHLAENDCNFIDGQIEENSRMRENILKIIDE